MSTYLSRYVLSLGLGFKQQNSTGAVLNNFLKVLSVGKFHSYGTAANPKYTEFQLLQMNEMCIVVDAEDRVLKPESKRKCHEITSSSRGLLHRAFSVFLFNSNGELLLQQRSDDKITFPGYYTNTCCSHPLFRPEEMVETGHTGVLTAAQRRLGVELGIDAKDISPSDMTYLTRIHYEAPFEPNWIEREIDYIIFIQKDLELNPNVEEVKDIRYVKKEDLKLYLKHLQDNNIPITPWFQLIVNKFLLKWWDNLNNLEQFKNHSTIHHV